MLKFNYKVQNPIVKVAPEPSGKEIIVKVGLIIATGVATIWAMGRFGAAVDEAKNELYAEAAKEVDQMVDEFVESQNKKSVESK